MQLSTRPDPLTEAPASRAETGKSGAIAAYGARRCRLCQARHPPFGFGPPLTRNEPIIWACSAHRSEVDRMLSRAMPNRAEKTQLKLL